MTKFIQLHLLTSYPASNLNRDDLGRPKTVRIGNTERIRISSQSLKRSWRVSDLFQESLGEHIGIRTRKIGSELQNKFLSAGIGTKEAFEYASLIASVFGKLQSKSVDIEQIVHISPFEKLAIDSLADIICTEKRAPSEEELKLLRHENIAIDMALFGRMLANKPEHNIEAACQVAHAFSVHSTLIEDDFFTAVDDLNVGIDDSGAGHLGESAFASALFYTYICIDKELLIENLANNTELANKAIAALVEAAVKISPKGKQNSYASRSYASFVLAEKGAQQPRSLSVAFLKSINSDDYLTDSINILLQQLNSFDEVYGKCSDERYMLNTVTSQGNFSEFIEFIKK
ncbi:type I-E CRISPR-associated protein Cas7/Cse4/CasC [Thorsellia kenyensis]|uniref:Type I-E CRISPR-associated protein Cas7/Cse4/CasC n=1 Tax=Thorsellia kenyensis TaxID=1549888 RepID=A0ABV6C733_9GAMM